MRELDGWPPPAATTPVTFDATDGGFAILFRFGAAAAVGLTPNAEARLLRQASLAVEAPMANHAVEDVDVLVDPSGPEGVDAHGRVRLHELSRERAQLLASVLAKSAVLADYEEQVAAVFDRIDPLSHDLQASRLPRRRRALLRELGDVLAIQARMVGRAEISEKPDVIWDVPALDRLYEHLAKEYELLPRDQALSRKLDLIADATGTYLDLLHNRHALRVEWYIVLLIVVAILLHLYDLFLA